MNPQGTTPPVALPVETIPAGHCYPPYDLSVTAVGTGVEFRWNSPHDNEHIQLRYWKNNQAPVVVIVTGDLLRINLLPGTRYNWSVRLVCDSDTDRGSIEVLGLPFSTGTPVQPCTRIDTTDAVVIQSGSTVRIQWDAIEGIKLYNIHIGISGQPHNLFTVSRNYFIYSMLIPDEDYVWYVTPVCPGAETSRMNFFRTGDASSHVPISLMSKVEPDVALMYWKNDPELTGLDIYLDDVFIRSIRHPVNMFTISSLRPDTRYRISIVPIYEKGEGDISFIDIRTGSLPVSVPPSLDLLQADDRITINWIPQENIAAQLLSINGSAIYFGNNVASYIIANPSPETRYFVSLQSINANGAVSFPITASITTRSFIEPPRQLRAPFISHDTVLLEWLHAIGASAYSVRYRTLAGIWSEPVVTTKTFHEISGLIPLTTYLIEVKGISGDKSSLSAVLSFVTLVQPAGVLPYLVTITNITPTSFDINYWLHPLDEDNVFRIDIIRLGVTVSYPATGSPVHITGLIPSSAYTIQFFNESNLDDIASGPVYNANTPAVPVVVPPVVAAITGLGVDVDGNLVHIYWNLTDADKYRIMLSSVEEDLIRYSDTNSLDLALDDLTNYSVTVNGVEGVTNGTATAPLAFKTGCFLEDDGTDCDPPLFIATIQDSNLNTPAITVGTKSDIVVRILNYNSQLRYMVTATLSGQGVPANVIMIGVQDPAANGLAIFESLPTGTYDITVTTFIGLDKYCSATQTAYAPGYPAPTLLVVSDETTDGGTVSWTQPAGKQPMGWEVYVDDELTALVGCNTYTFEGLTADTVYPVKIRAKYGSGEYSTFLTGNLTTLEEV